MSRSKEDKLLSLLREFKADERKYLGWFAEAEAKGDDKDMRIYHRRWKELTDRMELLLRNPRKFVRKWGYLYDLEN
ncbi:hypothetical protein COHA_002784 [Chlorella ohadii]|uniref:Uncharacterized protein n=1 Tax=Chlorella ohadii TaxID=2649997 RepID=A0AAD5DSK3_9CHLO|nr:hypothetical protein COHA_002784 [Chlorella ohadii]